MAGMDELIEDLPRLQTTPARHAGSCTELAGHDTADLRGETDADSARFVERDDDCLDGQTFMGPKPQLSKAVCRGDDGVLELQSWQRPDDVDQAPGIWQSRAHAIGS